MSSGIFLLIFIVLAIYLIYKLTQNRCQKAGTWHWIIFVTLPFILLLTGFISRSVITILFGAFLLFAITSPFLSSYLKSSRVSKGVLEAVFLFMTLGALIYCYILIKSFFLGITLLCIFISFLIAFIISNIRPKHSQ